MRRSTLPLMITALLLAAPAAPALAASDPGTMQQKDTLRDAVAAPLEDLNLKRDRHSRRAGSARCKASLRRDRA